MRHIQAYLSLPEGTATAAGLIAMMTDHYNILVRLYFKWSYALGFIISTVYVIIFSNSLNIVLMFLWLDSATTTPANETF